MDIGQQDWHEALPRLWLQNAPNREVQQVQVPQIWQLISRNPEFCQQLLGSPCEFIKRHVFCHDTSSGPREYAVLKAFGRLLTYSLAETSFGSLDPQDLSFVQLT
jgi:hypothetical protein